MKQCVSLTAPLPGYTLAADHAQAHPPCHRRHAPRDAHHHLAGIQRAPPRQLRGTRTTLHGARRPAHHRRYRAPGDRPRAGRWRITPPWTGLYQFVQHPTSDVASDHLHAGGRRQPAPGCRRRPEPRGSGCVPPFFRNAHRRGRDRRKPLCVDRGRIPGASVVRTRTAMPKGSSDCRRDFSSSPPVPSWTISNRFPWPARSSWGGCSMRKRCARWEAGSL